VTISLAADTLRVSGINPLRGHLELPGDKGISHRALILAACADGESLIENLATGQDVEQTRVVLGGLGVSVTDVGHAKVKVSGKGLDALVAPSAALDCGNSGSTMRMMAGLLAGRKFRSVLDGDDSLRQRPMARVIDPLRLLGAQISGAEDDNRAPLKIDGSPLVGTAVQIAVASGQVKSACLFAGLQAEGTTTVSEPSPSRDHTERLLDALGLPVERVDATTTRIRAGVVSPFNLCVPGDISSAAFLIVAALITPGSQITITGVGLNPLRTLFIEHLRAMGGQIEIEENDMHLGEPVGTIRVSASALRGTTIVASEGMIDEIPVLAVAAAFSDGDTEFLNVGELRVKESDRIATLIGELSKLGINLESTGDQLSVYGGKPKSGEVESRGDHRLALALAVAANAIEGETAISGWSAADVSYPNFSVDLQKLTAEN